MNNSVKVSIVIPVYNTENYLQQCLETLCNQTIKELQIICVDDGSRDNSVDIIKEFARKDSRVQILYHKGVGKGAGAARNYGIKHACGEYLLILDSDDYFELDLVEKTYNLAKLVDADVVLYDATYLNERGKHIRNYNTLNQNLLPEKDVFNFRDCKESFFQLTPGMAWSKLWRHKFIKENGIYFQENIPMADDVLFTYSAMAVAERIVALPERLINYRYMRAGNQSTNKDKAVLSSIEYAVALKRFLEEKDLYQELKYTFIRTVIGRSISHLRSFQSYEAFNKLFMALKSYLETEVVIDEEWKNIFATGEQDFSNWNVKRHLYNNINNILFMTPEEYLYEQYKEKDLKVANFPFELVEKGERIVLYGAGNIGKAYFNQNMRFHYCNIVAWADKNYLQLGFPICSPSHILNVNYDKIMIAIEKESIAEIIRTELIQIGIQNDKIIWESPFDFS